MTFTKREKQIARSLAMIVGGLVLIPTAVAFGSWWMDGAYHWSHPPVGVAVGIVIIISFAGVLVGTSDWPSKDTPNA